MRIKGYNTEVALREGGDIKGVVRTNKIHTKDWCIRPIKKSRNSTKRHLKAGLRTCKACLGSIDLSQSTSFNLIQKLLQHRFCFRRRFYKPEDLRNFFQGFKTRKVKLFVLVHRWGML